MSVYKRDNGIFYYNFTVNSRRYRGSCKTTVKALAEQYEAKYKKDLYDNKVLGKPHNCILSVKDLLTKYIEDHSKPNKKSWKDDEHLSQFLISHLGNRPITEITRDEAKKYHQIRKKEGGPVTANREIALIKSAYNKALYDWQEGNQPLFSGVNPFARISMFPEKAHDRWLTLEELKLVLSNSPLTLQNYLLHIVLTGIRPGELDNLNTKDYHPLESYIKLSEQITKNGHARLVPISRVLQFILANSKEGVGSFNRREFRGVRKAVMKLGVPHFRLYDFRHTFATYARKCKCDWSIIRDIMGHKAKKGYEMTARYAHADVDDLLEVAYKLDDFIFPSLPSHLQISGTNSSHLLTRKTSDN